MEPRAPAVARTTEHAAPTTGRFNEIHIGSVEVEIVPAPEPVKPSIAPPPPARTSPSVSLARGLTSPIGLRQS
jgi:hypothetical protein